jgi:hypothetical protein
MDYPIGTSMCCRKCLEHQLPNGDVNVLLEMFGAPTAQWGRQCAVGNVWRMDCPIGTSLCCWKCLEHRLLNGDVIVLLEMFGAPTAQWGRHCAVGNVWSTDYLIGTSMCSFLQNFHIWTMSTHGLCACVCVCVCVRVCVYVTTGGNSLPQSCDHYYCIIATSKAIFCISVRGWKSQMKALQFIWGKKLSLSPSLLVCRLTISYPTVLILNPKLQEFLIKSPQLLAPQRHQKMTEC